MLMIRYLFFCISHQFLLLYLSYGYAMVVADMRGTGPLSIRAALVCSTSLLLSSIDAGYGIG